MVPRMHNRIWPSATAFLDKGIVLKTATRTRSTRVGGAGDICPVCERRYADPREPVDDDSAEDACVILLCKHTVGVNCLREHIMRPNTTCPICPQVLWTSATVNLDYEIQVCRRNPGGLMRWHELYQILNQGQADWETPEARLRMPTEENYWLFYHSFILRIRPFMERNNIGGPVIRTAELSLVVARMERIWHDWQRHVPSGFDLDNPTPAALRDLLRSAMEAVRPGSRHRNSRWRPRFVVQDYVPPNIEDAYDRIVEIFINWRLLRQAREPEVQAVAHDAGIDEEDSEDDDHHDADDEAEPESDLEDTATSRFLRGPEEMERLYDEAWDLHNEQSENGFDPRRFKPHGIKRAQRTAGNRTLRSNAWSGIRKARVARKRTIADRRNQPVHLLGNRTPRRPTPAPGVPRDVENDDWNHDYYSQITDPDSPTQANDEMSSVDNDSVASERSLSPPPYTFFNAPPDPYDDEEMDYQPSLDPPGASDGQSAFDTSDAELTESSIEEETSIKEEEEEPAV